MTLKGGTTQACAACKYQRKRCTPECPLAPHFRPEQTEIFKNAHKLFGVKNILKVLDQIDPSQKTEAMRSIIYQANMRDRFPVHGCYGIVLQLHYQIRQAEKELYAVLSQLEFYKNQRRQHEIVLSPDQDSPESQQLQLGMGVDQPVSAASAAAALTLFQHEGVVVGDGDSHHQQQQQEQQFVLASELPIPSYSGNENGYNNSGIHMDMKENLNMGNFVWGPQTYCNENEDGGKGVVSLQSQLVNSTQQLTIQDEVTHDYDEIYPFFDTIDDTQSYMDSKEASSPESSPKETTHSVQHVAGNKLRSAELQVY